MTRFPILERSAGQTEIFAHRGGDLAGPEKENSSVAFQSALAAGVDHLETDVVLSADGIVLATHGSRSQADFLRTGLPLRSDLENMTWSEITGKVRVGGEPIPALRDLLTGFPEAFFNIDTKTRAVARPVGRLISKLGVQDRICLASFYGSYLEAAAEEAGGRKRVCTAAGPLGVAALACPNPDVLAAYMKRTGAACLQYQYRWSNLSPKLPNWLVLTKSRIERARSVGVPVIGWTINDPGDMKKAIASGIDGIMTDRIRQAKTLVKASF